MGHGIDVGGGDDPLAWYASLFGFESCRNWDVDDGDAQYLATAEDNSFDFLHSSHCLEHLFDPKVALENWIRVVKPRGYLVVVVPDEELYEHLNWPSRYNSDHKWSFTIYHATQRLEKSLNIIDLAISCARATEIIKIERIEEGYRSDLGDVDQTATATAECAIELVLRKRGTPP